MNKPDIEKCIVFNEPDSTDQLVFPLSEVVSKENNACNTNSIETDICLNTDSSSATMVNLHNFSNCTISQNLEDISEIKVSSNRRTETYSQQTTSVKRNLLPSGHKRKPNRKIFDSVKKMKKSDNMSISKPDAFSKNCKTFGRNPNHFQYSKSISDSPMKIFKDSLEIYDSLSDFDQANVLEEDFSHQKSHQYIDCSNLLNIDWSGIKFDVASKRQADSISQSCLLSQIGLSYSLLGPDIYTQCYNKIFENQLGTKVYSQGLSIGAIIEEVLFLDKERIRIQFEQFSHFGFVKTKDIYFRSILSGYKADTNSNSVPISVNSYVSSCMSTDLFHTALNIYHKNGCTYK